MPSLPEKIGFAAIVLAPWLCVATTADAAEKTVTSLPPAKDGIQLHVVCGSCKKRKDCLSVRAIGKNAPTASLILNDDSLCPGNPNISVEYSARLFTLSPTLAGALIKEGAGGEAIAHSYWLVAIIDGEISELWSATYSTREVVSIDSYTLKTVDSDRNGRQEIDYTAPFPTSNDISFIEDVLRSGEAGPDTWEHQVLEFSDARKAMVEKAHREEHAAVLTSTRSLADALTLKLSLLKDPKCAATRDFLVLDTAALPKLRKGFYVVAAISESRAAAQEKLNRINACRPDISGAIRRVR